MVLVDDDESAVRFCGTAATVPPGLLPHGCPSPRSPWRGPLGPVDWTGAVAPGRVLIGGRT